VIHAVLIAASVAFMVPLVWMISTSLKTNEEAMQMPPRWIPEKILWRNYVEALTYGYKVLGYYPFWEYFKNTLYLCVLSVVGTVMSNAMIAYGFARIKWKGREVLFWITLATMMIPFAVTMVPTYGIFKGLGWVGSYKPLWVPAFFGSAFNIFLLREFFRTIPTELTDAARIDGCSEFSIFLRIVLPLSKPALSVVALFNFLYMWNEFIGARIYLTEQKMFTLSLGLQAFQSQHGGTPWNYLMAASTVVVMPIIILFFFTQRTFIQGITLTGMKG
jgi:multiple sugar transport system permease protein